MWGSEARVSETSHTSSLPQLNSRLCILPPSLIHWSTPTLNCLLGAGQPHWAAFQGLLTCLFIYSCIMLIQTVAMSGALDTQINDPAWSGKEFAFSQEKKTTNGCNTRGTWAGIGLNMGCQGSIHQVFLKGVLPKSHPEDILPFSPALPAPPALLHFVTLTVFYFPSPSTNLYRVHLYYVGG